MTSLRERELGNFWRAASTVNLLRRTSDKDDEMSDAAAELEALARAAICLC